MNLTCMDEKIGKNNTAGCRHVQQCAFRTLRNQVTSRQHSGARNSDASEAQEVSDALLPKI